MLPPMKRSGVFLVLDGADGCGKSTQAAALVARLQARGRAVVHTREPGGTALGERLRALLLDPALGDIAPIAEVLLYQASRAQLVDEVIRPALEAGHVVVCERWHYATRAYQGAYAGIGRRAEDALVVASSALAVGETEPDRAILLDLPTEAAHARLGGDLDRVEARGADYRARVAERFRSIFAESAPRLRVISAAGTVDEVAARVWESLRDLFE
jgi:dTMP kinase